MRLADILPHIPMRIPRRILLILASLLMGALTTIAISWHIAARGSLHRFTGQYTHPAGRFDLSILLWNSWPTPQQMRVMPGTQRGYEVRGIDFSLPGHEGDREGQRLLTLWSTRFGWPMHALESLEVYAPAGNEQAKLATDAFTRHFPHGGALQMPAALIQPTPGATSLLPAWPIPLGFAIDTALYATLAATLISLPGILKRRAWKRDGKCLHCGYEIANLPTCPECATPAQRTP